ncbi:MAG: VWA domain-containing protein [Bryobacteraceae bacterium]|nr:VWA domain-containing protein [Bryobacteraceae bacterium]
MRKQQTRARRQKGFAVILTALCMIMVIPTVGLAIDAGFMYAIKAKLSAAADAGALAAARSLSVGLTIQAQEASAVARATAFFNANFPDGFLQTSNKQVNVTVAQSAYRTRTVRVVATVTAPVFFMRILGFRNSTIGAEGTASRRDVNLILVLDRSQSMVNTSSLEPMKAAARQFVAQFANDRDRLGMITFGMTWLNAYPYRQNFKTSSPSLDTAIANIQGAGGTGTAQALSQAYLQLQAINEPGSLNLVVFFTDGLPNGLTANFPVKRLTDTRYGYGADNYSSTSSTYSMAPSTCRDSSGRIYGQSGWNPGPKLGVIAATGNAVDATGASFGVTVSAATSYSQSNEGVVISDNNTCRFATDWSYVRRDIAYIPDQDYYGNNTRTTYLSPEKYPSGHAYAGYIRVDKPLAIGRASKNAAADAARKMRQDPNLAIVIYCIGEGDVDEDLLMRVANDPASTAHTSSEPEGLYVYAPDSTQLNQAFARIASEILRIAR